MNRGEVWWVDFSGRKGGEVQKTRPAIIVSNNSANKFLNRVQVVPLSTQVEKIYPSEAPLTVSGKQSKAMADQITTVAKVRLTNKIGILTSKDLASVERIVRLQLDL